MVAGLIGFVNGFLVVRFNINSLMLTIGMMLMIRGLANVLANALGGLAIDNIPTSGVVALEFALDSWRDLAVGKGTLLFFDSPKNHG